MAKPVYIPELGKVVEFPDSASNEQITAQIKTMLPQAAAAPAAAAGPDQSGVLGRFGYGLARGFTDIPGGIAALGLPAEKAAATSAGQFSEEAAKYLQDVFGIDPTKDPTAAQQVAEALGGVASFLVPYAGEAKLAGLVGMGVKATKATGLATGAAQGAALNAGQRAETIKQQLASGMKISEEAQLAAQRMDGLIGLTEVAPLGKFFGPIGKLLSKVPATKAPVVERIIQSRLVNLGKAGVEEGAQEAASGIASDIMEANIYNPDVEIGQDLLSSFGTGAAAGSLTEGLIHLAMGRKAAPYRQLQQDLATERMQNSAALRQGRVANAAETLRKNGIVGPLDVKQEEVDGLPRFIIKTPEGKSIAEFENQSDAVSAIDLYKKRTNANVMVREDVEPPDVFPVEVAGIKFGNLDEIKGARDKEIATRDGISKHITDPRLLKANAANKGVSEELYAQTVKKRVEAHDAKIKKLNDFLSLAEPKVKKSKPVVQKPVTAVPEAAPDVAEALPAKPLVPTPTPVPEAAVEAPIEPVVEAPAVEEPPIGAREFPTQDDVAAEPAAAVEDVVEAPVTAAVEVPVEAPAEAPVAVAEPAPEAAAPPQTPATIEQRVDLQMELFDKVIGVQKMTPEQKIQYESELNKRFPAEPFKPSTAGQVSGIGKVRPLPPVGTSFGEVALTPEAAAIQKRIDTELNARLATIAPPTAKLKTQQFIDQGENYLIRGSENNGLINIALGVYDPNLSVEQHIEKLMGVLNHEVIHTIRGSGRFRESEWRILARAAENTKIPGKKYTYLDKASSIYTPDLDAAYGDPDAVIEEAIAEMYRDWTLKQKAAPNTAGLFNRMTEIFRRIFRLLKSNAYENVFKQIESGEMRGREASETKARGSLFSAAPVLDSDEFKTWFRNSKVKDKNGEPLVVYHHGSFTDDGNFIPKTPMHFGTLEAAHQRAFGKRTDEEILGVRTYQDDSGLWHWEDSSGYTSEDAGYGGFVSEKNALQSGHAEVINREEYQDLEAEDLGITVPAYLSIQNIKRVQDVGGANGEWDAEIEKAKKEGFDGIVYRNLYEDKGSDSYIAFYPEQVKSPDSKFSESSQDIRFSAAPALNSDEFKNWYSGSTLRDENGAPLKLYTGTSKDVVFESFKDSDRGTWVTSDPVSASDYSLENDSMDLKLERVGLDYEYVKKNTKSRVVPVYASVKNVLDLSTREKQDKFYEENKVPTFGGVNGYQKEQAFIGRIAMRRGYDAIQWAPNVWAVFNPKKNIKSQFNEFTAKSISSPKFSAAPLPTYLEEQNQHIFAPVPNVSFKDMVFDFFGFGPGTVGKTLRTANGDVVLSEKTMRNISRRMNVVDRNAYIAHLEKIANEQDRPGQFERMVADDSALAALIWRGRSSHVNASMIIKGKLTLNYARPGDLLSATMKVEDDPDSMLNISKILLEPGPTMADGTQKDKRELFKMYATAKRGIGLKAKGKPLPAGITDQYIRQTISLVDQSYPEVAEAYRMYQRFNKNLLTTAMNAGLISQQELADLTSRMDYYGYYREMYEEDIVPTSSQKTASRFNLREYKGSQRGGLINDPLYVMLQNSNFWVDSIAKNIAATKSFNLLNRMGEARLLGTGEKPNRDQGEEEQVMFYKDRGVLKRFAVKDPMLAIALGSDDRIDMGSMMKWLSMPTGWLRESVTRDPGFMFANLARDTMSTWITSGADIIPFISTIKGGVTALKGGSSFQALMGRGVVGSYDLGMKDPKDLAKTIARRAGPKNVNIISDPRGLINVTQSLWDKMGSLSEASDAATRIAVYDAAIAQGMSEAEASLRAIEILDFSRHGSNQILSLLTKLIPFLNARIQGLDVVWQAGKAAGKFIAGKQQSERDTQIGKKFLVRGGALAVISMALEMINEDDEDYKNLEDYVKNSNLLIPLKSFGLKGQFIGIPKPFESGLMFSTFPQQFYKTMQGDATSRENIALFTSSLGSTFGVNPIPQLLLPAIEVLTNHDFYTGLPLIPEGKSRLASELQYNASTSSLAMLIGKLPISYNMTSGKFEGISPIIIDNLIGGYGGPLGTYIAEAISISMETAEVGPERLPKEITRLPVVRRFFIDAQNKNPKVVSQAYELYGLVDEANRSFSRLRQMGDVEATMDYLNENKTLLSYKKYVFKLADGLNKLSARERAIERDGSMTRDEKLAAVQEIRQMKIKIASKVADINKALGR